MRAVAILIALVGVTCSSGSVTPSGSESTKRSTSQKTQLLRVFTGQQTLAIQMTPDDRVLDGSGVTVGTFDANSRVVTVSSIQIPLAEVVRRQADRRVELELPIGRWQIEVAASGDINVNDEQWGRVEGFDATPQAWRRLEALLAALPAISTASHSRGQSP
jgi:hypothetical protein